MKIDEGKVKTKSLYWKSIYGDKNAEVSLTSWLNGDGWDIVVNSNNSNNSISLTEEELCAIMTLYSSWYLKEPE